MENKKTNEFNRMLFLETVIREFLNKSSYSSLKTAYDGHIRIIRPDADPERRDINKQKIKILDSCFEKFTNPEFKQLIETIKAEKNPKPQVLVRAIAKSLAEDVLGDNKRTYDMSDRFSAGQITPNSTRLAPVKGLSVTVNDFFGNNVSVQKVGTLTYDTPAVKCESIDKYKIFKTLSDSNVQECEIFSFIDLNMLKRDKEYRDAVLGELLSKNNIELSNTRGYVGQIVSTKNSPVQLKVGDQRQNREKFYRYQVSQDYALIYDPQDLTAVVSHARQQALNNHQTQKIAEPKEDKEDIEK